MMTCHAVDVSVQTELMSGTEDHVSLSLYVLSRLYEDIYVSKGPTYYTRAYILF